MIGTRSLPIALLALLNVADQAEPVFASVDTDPVTTARGVTRGAAWGDFDGDGDPDLFVTRPPYDGPPQRNALYRNLGDGQFARVAAFDGGDVGAWEGAVWVDVDNDGDLDLHVVGRSGAGSMLFENRPGGNLVRRDRDPFGGTVRSASMACWADLDGDGRLDVFMVGYRTGRNALYRNAGSWRFDAVPLEPPARGDGSGRACIAGDLDGDRLPEIVVANAHRPDLLLRNRGAMAFVVDTTTPLEGDTAYGYGLSLTDANGDGRRDLFVANFDAANTLYLGQADGRLVPVRLGDQLQSAASKGHAWGDFDLDGRIDLYVGSGTPGPGMVNRLYLGTPDGRFRLADGGPASRDADTSAAVAAADYDLDGDLDLFVANWGSPGSTSRLYRNTTTHRSWLKVRLEGVCSNRMGSAPGLRCGFRSTGLGGGCIDGSTSSWDMPGRVSRCCTSGSAGRRGWIPSWWTGRPAPWTGWDRSPRDWPSRCGKGGETVAARTRREAGRSVSSAGWCGAMAGPTVTILF